MPAVHPSRGVRRATGYLSLEFRRQVRAGDTRLRVGTGGDHLIQPEWGKGFSTDAPGVRGDRIIGTSKEG